MKIVFILSALVAAALAAPSGYSSEPKYGAYQEKGNYGYMNGYGKDKYEYAPAYYHYKYDVNDDYHYVNFGAEEDRNGDYTKGYYYVDLPDGRRQKVNYYVDGYSGYVADVTYEGEAKYADNYNKPYGYNTYKNNKGSYNGYENKSYENKGYAAPSYRNYESQSYMNRK